MNLKNWSNGLKKMAIGWALQAQLLGTDAACKPGQQQEFGQAGAQPAQRSLGHFIFGTGD